MVLENILKNMIHGGMEENILKNQGKNRANPQGKQIDLEIRTQIMETYG